MQERQQALQQAAAEQTSRAERRLVLPDAPPPQTQELTTAIRDAAAAAMRATEAEARVDVLQRQADTLRAQSMAVQASLRERVESLTVRRHLAKCRISTCMDGLLLMLPCTSRGLSLASA